jgi:hypothetical protein
MSRHKRLSELESRMSEAGEIVPVLEDEETGRLVRAADGEPFTPAPFRRAVTMAGGLLTVQSVRRAWQNYERAE